MYIGIWPVSQCVENALFAGPFTGETPVIRDIANGWLNIPLAISRRGLYDFTFFRCYVRQTD